MERRSALKFGFAVTTAVAARALAQAPAPKGVSRKAWGKRDSMIPGYKSVAMRDIVYEPGAKTSNPKMPNDMVCHVPQGELRVTQSDGMAFVVKQGELWTCRTGIGEDVENAGATVAIMRIIDLIPA